MKKYTYFIFLLGIILGLESCNSQKTEQIEEEEIEENTAGFPRFKFDKIEHDFGKITPGMVVKETFAFENIGAVPLVITNARASCGCTLPQYPKDKAIASGEKSEITVEFNSTGKIGQQNKTITVFSNVKGGKTELKIYASVEYDNDPLPDSIQ